ncbi:hypothetical protein [Nocardioides sp. L-11A]|uniref:hypothetical protein n=1 Tax=Nocardioides sp. L-11A TaxID=3043848 RepID=UPI00249A6992|nr:hypothetical protein QJ852_02065 [Nocardioides sp. L-11A]
MRAVRGLLATALLGLAVLLVPDAAHAGPYAPAVPAQCRVAVPATVAGDRVVVRVRVSAPGSLSTAGTVAVEVRARGTRRTLWRSTGRHTGEELVLEGPRLPHGRYVARARFTPDAADVLGCSDRADVAVGAPGARAEGGGALPDTGGPHLVVVLAGLGLLVTGSGIATRHRRGSPG